MTIANAGLIFASVNPRDQDESCFVGRKDKTGFQSILAITSYTREPSSSLEARNDSLCKQCLDC